MSDVIKGFIEVTAIDNQKRLLNVSHIEDVWNNTIYLMFNFPNMMEQDYIDCQETYEEIKQKIKEASE